MNRSHILNPLNRLLGALMVVALLATSGPSHACTCVALPWDEAFEQALKHSSMIFCGRVIEKEVPEGPLPRERVHTIVVLATWSAGVPDTVLVWTAAGGSACGVDLPTGVDMLLFTYPHGVDQTPGSCDNNQFMEMALYSRYRLGEPEKRAASYNHGVLSLEDIFEMAGGSNDRVRLSAALTLAMLPAERDVILPRLKEMLKSSSPYAQQAAIYALGSMKNAPPEVQTALENALKSPSAFLRLQAFSTLQMVMRKCDFFPYALRGLADKSDDVRSASARSLIDVGKCLSNEQKESLEKAIEDAMDGSTVNTRCFLIQGLVECGCVAADWIPKLETWKVEDNWVGYCAGKTAAALRKACPDSEGARKP